MAEISTTSYDVVPYDSRPRPATHPDSLTTLATLLGMRPAPVARCRVLELGCATGGNLLPLAEAYPESQFVGIDLSSRQIDIGRQVARALKLDNLELHARGILEIDESFGLFDYVICHGVYSWVPAEVRDGILAAARQRLAPQGVAYVSYNTYPGWYLRRPVRDMMQFHVAGLHDPVQKTQQARAMLEFLVQATAPRDDAWSRLLRDEAELIRPEGDYYVFHEHLEEDNHPVYFHQFIAHARAHGLQYLGEAHGHATIEVFPPEVQETLRRISPDLLHLEQYLDFLKNQTFRRTLLVHDAVTLNRKPGPEVVFDLYVTGESRPTSPQVDLTAGVVVEFHNDHGATLATNVPIAKAALVVLFEQWPRCFAFGELCQAARDRLGAEAPPEEVARALLARSLVQLYLAGLAALHATQASYVVDVSDRPRASPLSRLQAKTGARVGNRRQRLLELNGLDRAVLALLDGEHDRPMLIEALTARVLADELELHQDGQPLRDEASIRTVLSQELEPSLQRLAHSVVLIG